MISAARLHNEAPYPTIEDEQGASSTAQNGVQQRPSDWDEEVVPALKKRLAAEKEQLEQRMQDVGLEYSAQHASSTGRPRPTPRRKQYDEIIQDGLGSDELIPSEWATGSNARFLTATSRSQDRKPMTDAFRGYDTTRSTSESYAYSRPWDGDPPEHVQHSHMAESLSPHLVRAEPPSQTTTNETPFVAHARERARRLARERRQDAESPVDGLITERINDTDEQRSTTLTADRLLRISSSPGLRTDKSNALQITREANEHNASGGENMAEQAPGLRKVDSHNSMREKGRSVTPSKIPLPVSGSMDKYTSGGQRRKTEPSGQQDGESVRAASPAHPDGHDTGRVSLRQRTASSAARTPVKIKQTSAPQSNPRANKYSTLQNSPPTQDVLDEFGPLGGTPKATQNERSGFENTENTDEFGMPRSTSNPWDEELLPTVKRRLAQQAMLQRDPRFSRADDLIDTWDRNGMPLSTRSVRSLQQNAAGLPSGPRDAVIEPDEEKENVSPSNEARRLSVQQDARMKRLTEQLDIGFQASSRSNSMTDHTAPLKAGKAEEETSEGQGALPSRQRAKAVAKNEQARQTYGQNEKQKQPVDASADARNAEDAGCCKCTIM